VGRVIADHMAGLPARFVPDEGTSTAIDELINAANTILPPFREECDK